MYGSMKTYLQGQLTEIRNAGLEKPERVITSPQGNWITTSAGKRSAEPVRQQLPWPGEPSGSGPCRSRELREMGLRPGLRPIHLRHAADSQGPGGGRHEVPRHGRHDHLRLLLRRQRRPVRDPHGRAGRHHQRPVKPRQHHRRRPPVQGPATALQQQRHEGPRRAAQVRPVLAIPPDRHRRRLLHGWLHRQARRDLRPRGPLRRDGHDRRLPRPRRHRRAPAVAPPNTEA